MPIEKEILLLLCLVLSAFCLILLSFILYMRLSKSRNHLIKKANDDARRIKMNSIADAKVGSARIYEEVGSEINQQLANLEVLKNDLQRKRELFYKDLEKIEIKEEYVNELEKKNLRTQKTLNKIINEYNEKLSNISNLSIENVRNELMESTKVEINSVLSRYSEIELEKIKNQITNQAREILISSMEKMNVDVVAHNSSVRVPIPDLQMKGKIIGKDGRNIKAFEQYGGIDIIIDESPNSITISSFNPIRREIAIRALNTLMDDGRIQPVRIEEALIEEEKKINIIIEESGEEAFQSLGIFDLNSELKSVMGRLKFRTSFNQNVLQHSMEVAKLCSIIAAELNLDPYIALKAGFLHDIGKAVDYEEDGSHVALGVKLLKKYNVDEIIINAVEAHHGDVKGESFYAEIVKIADSMSASRPGARNNSSEDFFVRMDEIESKLKEINGIKDAYVLQSGRQIRVMVSPDIIDDFALLKVNNEIKNLIQEINKTPGEIVITLIREKRIISKINSISDD